MTGFLLLVLIGLKNENEGFCLFRLGSDECIFDWALGRLYGELSLEDG